MLALLVRSEDCQLGAHFSGSDPLNVLETVETTAPHSLYPRDYKGPTSSPLMWHPAVWVK